MVTGTKWARFRTFGAFRWDNIIWVFGLKRRVAEGRRVGVGKFLCGPLRTLR